MAKRGRKPKPTAIKKAAGNPGRRKLSTKEPEYKGSVTCPAFLTADAKREWKRMFPILREHKLVTPADRAMFAGYCQSYADYIEANKAMAEQGKVVKGDRGWVKNPWVGIADRAYARLLKACSEFGLTPCSRAQVVAPEKKAGDDMDDFVNGKPRLKMA